jgi:hypothetical protein
VEAAKVLQLQQVRRKTALTHESIGDHAAVGALRIGMVPNLRAAQLHAIPPERRSNVKDQLWLMGLSGVALWSTMPCLATLDFDRALS